MSTLVAASVTATATFAVRSQRVLFPARPYSADAFHADYDVHPDGQRFLTLRHVECRGGERIWVENSFEELKASVAN